MSVTEGAAPQGGTRVLRVGLTTGAVGVLLGVSLIPAATVPATVAAVGAAIGGGGWIARAPGGRADRRSGALVLALSPLLGYSQPRPEAVRARRWTRGRHGVPRVIQLSYAPGVDWEKPTWRPAVLGAARRLLGTEYTISSHDPRRCVLELVPHQVEEVVVDPMVQRATRTARDLMGESARVVDEVLIDGELRAFTIHHQVATRAAAIGFCRRVERTMAATLPGRWRAQWDRIGDTVNFEVVPTLPDSVWMPVRDLPDSDDLLETYKQVEIPLGVDVDGREMTWRPAVLPQMLVIGATGRGKTSFVTGVVVWAARFGWPVWISDAKRVEFLNLRDWPNVQIVAGTISQQVALIHRARDLMEHRYQLIESGQARAADMEPLFVVLDEHAEFVAELTSWYLSIKQKGDPAKPPVLDLVASLARKARTARIHLVTSMQRPDVALIGGGEFRDNFGMRVSLGRLTTTAAQMTWGDPTVGVTLPAGRIGRAMVTDEGDLPTETQTYRVPSFDVDPDSEEWALLMALRPSVARHERLLILDPGDDVDPETGDPVVPTYRDYANARWVKATDYPHLDPLNSQTVEGVPVDGRALSSPMAVLGLADTTAPPAARYTATGPVVDLEEVDGPETDDLVEEPEMEGYGDAEYVRPADLRVGDLVELDQGWGVVSEEPILDPDMPEYVVVPLRVEDEDDVLSIDADDHVLARRGESDLEEM